MVGVVLGVEGPLSRLRWLWTGLCAGGTSGLRAGSLRENSETALCTGGQRGETVSRALGPHMTLFLLTPLRTAPRPPARTSTMPRSRRHCGGVLAKQPNQTTTRQSPIVILSKPLETTTSLDKIRRRNKLNGSVRK